MPYTTQPDIKTGGNGTVLVDGQEVFVRNWNVNKTNAFEDITTTGDYVDATGRTWTRNIITTTTEEITFDAFVDVANDVLAAIEDEDQLENVIVQFRDGKTRTYPLVIVKSINMTSGGVVGANKYSVTAQNQGPSTHT